MSITDEMDKLGMAKARGGMAVIACLEPRNMTCANGRS